MGATDTKTGTARDAAQRLRRSRLAAGLLISAPTDRERKVINRVIFKVLASTHFCGIHQLERPILLCFPHMETWQHEKELDEVIHKGAS